MITVIGAVIRSNGKILICKRGAGGSCAYLWEFPGGKLEPGEEKKACLIRECREELSVEVRPLGLLEEFEYAYPDQRIAFSFYESEITEGTLQKNVHEELRWVTPAELLQFSFCPADVGLVRRLAGEQEEA